MASFSKATRPLSCVPAAPGLSSHLFCRVTAHDLLHVAVWERSGGLQRRCFQMPGPQFLLLCTRVSASVSLPPPPELQALHFLRAFAQAGLSARHALPKPFSCRLCLLISSYTTGLIGDPLLPFPHPHCVLHFISNDVNQPLIHLVHSCVPNTITEPCSRKGSVHIWWVSGLLAPVPSTVLSFLCSPACPISRHRGTS